MMRTKTITSLTCSLVFLLLGASSYAAPLSGHVDAYNGWTGSAVYNDGGDLFGTIEYAVFLAADFNANFAGDGYVPGDSLVYAYQIFNEGDDFVSTEFVGVINDANTIGQFDIGDVAASSMLLDIFGGFAQWDFDSPSISAGQSSWGLAFSSPNIPEMGASLTINGGSNALAVVPTPSAVKIPEPSSMILLSLSGGLVMFLRWRWG